MSRLSFGRETWSCHVGAAVFILGLFGSGVVPASAQVGGRPRSTDCRVEGGGISSGVKQTVRHIFLPEGDLFAPPLADQKEPRFSFSYQRVHFSEGALPSDPMRSTIDAGLVSAGGVYGLWGRREVPGCDGVQVGLTGGVFSQFNLDAPSQDLINTDFIIGTQITARRAGVSGRVRLYHQSSHLGDEFLLHNPTVVRVDFGFQAIEALGSYEHAWWRLYGGGGYIFFKGRERNAGMLQGGAEVHGAIGDTFGVRPVASLDVTSLQARDWKTTTSAVAGLEWASAYRTRRLRALLVFVDGYSPFGQFSVQQTVRNAGLQLQLEF